MCFYDGFNLNGTIVSFVDSISWEQISGPSALTFGDKEQLFKKSFELYRKSNVEGLIQFFESRLNDKNGFIELFDIAIQEAITDKEAKGCFVVNTTTERIPNDENLMKVVEDNKRVFENLFYDYLKKGKEDNQLKTNQDLKN